jgi:hypothetical protein
MTTPTTGNTGPYLDQQLHVLVDEDTRAFTLGGAALAAEGTGRPPREGDAVRQLLVATITDVAANMPEEYARIMTAGRAELARRAEATDRRKTGAAAQG